MSMAAGNIMYDALCIRVRDGKCGCACRLIVGPAAGRGGGRARRCPADPSSYCGCTSNRHRAAAASANNKARDR